MPKKEGGNFEFPENPEVLDAMLFIDGLLGSERKKKETAQQIIALRDIVREQRTSQVTGTPE